MQLLFWENKYKIHINDFYIKLQKLNLLSLRTFSPAEKLMIVVRIKITKVAISKQKTYALILGIGFRAYYAVFIGY
mgnify:CR=1 FL=1